MSDTTEPKLAEVDCSCDCKACTKRESRFYRLNAKCTNCGDSYITKHRVGDKRNLGVKCPYCGVGYFAVYGTRVSSDE